MAEESKAANASKSRLSGGEVIQRARAQLEEMMGRPAESVLGMLRDGEGWKVTFEAVELQRVPASTDVLGSYEVDVDGNGDVVGYRRVRRYFRNRAGEG
jgi:hypothetical protein